MNSLAIALRTFGFSSLTNASPVSSAAFHDASGTIQRFREEARLALPKLLSKSLVVNFLRFLTNGTQKRWYSSVRYQDWRQCLLPTLHSLSTPPAVEFVSSPADILPSPCFKRDQLGAMAMLIPREEIEARVSRQLQLVSEAAKSEQRPKIIFNLHGIAGIGKSCVVQRLLAEYDDHLSFLWIDFNPDPGIQAAEDTQHKTLAELLQTLRDLHGFDQIHSDVVDADNRPVETTQHNVMYRYRIESANSFPELVLLDGLDGLTYWRWIQRNIIKPLAEAQRSLVIVTSQPPLFWHFWELRESTDEIEVQPFSPDETHAYLKQLQSSWIFFSSLLYTYTRGYPFGIKHLRQILDANYPAINTSTELLLMHDIQHHFTPETSQIIRFIGFLRKPTIPDMHLIMQHVQPEEAVWSHRASAREQLTRVTFEMRQKHSDFHFVEPSTPARRGIRFNEQFRLTIEHDLMGTNRDLYLLLCEKLCIRYEEQVDANPNLHFDLFTEWLYFSVPLVRAGRITGEVWGNSYHRLIGRVKLVANIHSLIAQDESLLRQLQTLPEREQCLIGELIFDPSICEQYVDGVLSRIEPEPVSSTGGPGIPDYLSLLQHIPSTKNPFDVQEWRRKLKESNKKVGEINNIIPILHSRSMIVFDRKTRKYRLNAVLRPVVERLRYGSDSDLARTPAVVSYQSEVEDISR
jgi:hypothetical protein